MKITCPHCGITGSAHDSKPGAKVRCPQCEKVFVITEQKVACPHCLVIGTVQGAIPGNKFRCPQCSKVFALTPELIAAGLPIPASPMAETEVLAASVMPPEITSVPEQAPMEPEAEEIALFAEEAPEVETISEPEAEPAKEEELPTKVCAGCGGSFHPDYLQEVNGVPMCGLCQLRIATAEEKAQTEAVGKQKLRGTLAAIALLGAIALALVILKKMGIL